jgi:hypothetical protein
VGARGTTEIHNADDRHAVRQEGSRPILQAFERRALAPISPKTSSRGRSAMRFHAGTGSAPPSMTAASRSTPTSLSARSDQSPSIAIASPRRRRGRCRFACNFGQGMVKTSKPCQGPTAAEGGAVASRYRAYGQPHSGNRGDGLLHRVMPPKSADLHRRQQTYWSARVPRPQAGITRRPGQNSLRSSARFRHPTRRGRCPTVLAPWATPSLRPQATLQTVADARNDRTGATSSRGEPFKFAGYWWV